MSAHAGPSTQHEWLGSEVGVGPGQGTVGVGVGVGVIDDIEGTMWRRSSNNGERTEPIDLTVPDEDDSLDIPTFLRKQAD
jgi:hypothetical protein